MKYVFANRISALITATLSSTDLNVQLETGAGVLLPALGTDEIIRATLIAPDGTSEIVNGLVVTGDVVTLQRGQEGTPAGTFPVGSRFEMRVTAGIADNWLQRSGGTMTGPIDMANQELQRAKFTAATVFNVLHANIVRSAAIPPDQPFNGPTENSINIPPNSNVGIEARRPRYLGRPIVNAQMFDGVILDYHGDIVNLPPHLKLCDGTGGTPDLRGRFLRGWDTSFGVGDFGGSDTRTTDPGGAHDHGGLVTGTAITIAQMPPHAHPVPNVAGSGGTEGSDGQLGSGTRNTNPIGGGEPHQHGIPDQAAHTHTLIVRPLFYTTAKVKFAV